MLNSLITALQPAGLVLVGAGLGSLIFSGPLAKLDSLMESIGFARIDPEYSRKWVEVAGAVWGVVGVGLLIVSYYVG